MRVALKLFAAAALVALILAVWGYANARADPVVRRAAVALPGWPVGAPPIRVAVISDIHIGNRAMNSQRLRRIVARVNALRPDIVLLAGDFVAGHDPALAARYAPRLIAPLAGLRARIGTLAVLGNHDQWTGAIDVRDALERAGVIVLENDAVRRGPLTIIGVGDIYTRHADIARAVAASRGMAGASIVLSHGPDIVPLLPPGPRLVIAGHTHCGQIVLPGLGALAVPSKYGSRYLCGIVREGHRATVVTGGVGTSILPFRFGAPPDVWLLTLQASAHG